MKNSIIQNDINEIIEEDLPFQELANSTVLITGGNGMIASYIIYTLLFLNEKYKWNIKIVGCVRNKEKALKHFGSINERRDFQLLVQDVCTPFVINEDINYIIHAASQASPIYFVTDPVGTILGNTLGTYNLLELARIKKSTKFMLLSTGEIYGKPPTSSNLRIRESDYGIIDSTDVRSCYPAGKKAAETMCVSFSKQYGVNCLICRLSYIYGPGLDINDSRVYAEFISNVINNENIVLKSDGSIIRTYTYIADAVSALFYVLLKGTFPVYNIANDDVIVSIKEIAQTLIDLFPEKKLKLVFDIPKDGDNFGYSKYSYGILDSSRVRNLGWKPHTGIRSGLEKTVNSYEGKY